jgi:polyisoprenoid-binding protein YceI
MPPWTVSRTDGSVIMSTATAAIREVDGRQLPAPGEWVIDPAHSDIQLIARHMMIAKVRGRFRAFSGKAVVDEVPERTWCGVVIDAASIDTGDEQRDAHLRSPDFLDVERYPEIVFRSTGLRPADHGRWVLTGDVTVRDVVRSVDVDLEFNGVAEDPWGNARAAFLATAEIDREQFDITWNQALETGGFLVGNGVKVEADLQLVLQTGGSDAGTG